MSDQVELRFLIAIRNAAAAGETERVAELNALLADYRELRDKEKKDKDNGPSRK